MADPDLTVAEDTPEMAERRARSVEVARVHGLLKWPNGQPVTDNLGIKRYTKPPLRIPQNVEIILRKDDRYLQALEFDAFAGEATWEREPITDADLTRIRLEMGAEYKLQVSLPLIHEIAEYVARDREYHPVRDYLERLRWDGIERIDRLLSSYAGCDDAPVLRTVARRFLIGAVARIYEPGCKLDTVLILSGRQGLGKSTFFLELAGVEWFRDDALDLRHKDAAMALKGVWLYELAELASTRVRDAETVKGFLSRRVDSFRAPYARKVTSQPRQSVFVGTTNEPAFLNDPTGARRFWPAECKRPPDLLATKRDRDQLWAEAVEAYKRGERWHLERNEARELEAHQERYRYEEPWVHPVRRWLATRDDRPHTAHEILVGALGKDPDKQHKGDTMKLGQILSDLGWHRGRATIDGAQVRCWLPPHLDED